VERPQRSEDERPCGGRAPSEDCSSKAVDFILTLGVVSSPNSVSANTLTGLSAEIGHLRTALEAVADRVRQHEERLRHIEARQPRRKAN